MNTSFEMKGMRTVFGNTSGAIRRCGNGMRKTRRKFTGNDRGESATRPYEDFNAFRAGCYIWKPPVTWMIFCV